MRSRLRSHRVFVGVANGRPNRLNDVRPIFRSFQWARFGWLRDVALASTASFGPGKVKRMGRVTEWGLSLGLLVLAVLWSGCSSNRFQVAERSDDVALPRSVPIVPPTPQASVAVSAPTAAPGSGAVAVVPVPRSSTEFSGLGSSPPLGSAGTIPVQPEPAPGTGALSLNPNPNQTGARNRRRVTETPRPGAEGSRLDLQPDGPELVGRVLNAFGQPQPYASIQVRDLRRPGQIVAETAAGAGGAFRVRNLAPGVQYQLSAAAEAQGRRLLGTTVAVAPNTAVIIQVDYESSRVSQSRPLPRPGREEQSLALATAQTRQTASIGGALHVPPVDTWDNHRGRRYDPFRSVSRPVRVPSKAEDIPAPSTDAFGDSRLASLQLTALDGQTRRLNELSGDLILLDFYGSWCGPCRRCIPKLNQLHREFEARGLNVVGVACEYGSRAEAIATAKDARVTLGAEYTVLVSPLDDESPIRDYFGVSGYPTLVLLDHAGNILYKGTGGDASTIAQLRGAIQRNLR